jgi:hypothetical protein
MQLFSACRMWEAKLNSFELAVALQSSEGLPCLAFMVS